MGEAGDDRGDGALVGGVCAEQAFWRLVSTSVARRDTGLTAPAVVLVVALVLAACSSSAGEGSASDDNGSGSGSGSGDCPTTVDADELAEASELRELTAEFNAFGLRSPGSDQHEASLDWLADQLSEVPGLEVEWDPYTMDRWQPTPAASGGTPGRDLAAAGGLTVGTGPSAETVPVAGAVPFSLPTTEDGVRAELAYLPADQEITAANAADRVVVREIPHSSLPYAAFDAIGHYTTDDLPTEGNYDRPYLRPLHQMLVDAGRAGAAGLVLVWDAPTDQLRGYWDPHHGIRYQVPAVFVGNDQAATLQDLAASGAEAQVVVRAEWDEAETRNLIATLPGRSRERIVVNTNTDSVTWVQENGVVAAIALARYLGDLPEECRRRDVVFALTSSHLGMVHDGNRRYAPQLDEDYDDGTVAFVMAIEHLGAQEILPASPGGELELTGEHEVFAWSAPAESPVLVEASVDAVQRRGLDRTAVLEGAGAPVPDQVPSICSQGGLGTVYHSHLIPTIAGISGPWSLWAPAFGEEAIDFERMRDQTLAFGDIALALDDVPRDEIAGDYPAAREARANGAPTCPAE